MTKLIIETAADLERAKALRTAITSQLADLPVDRDWNEGVIGKETSCAWDRNAEEWAEQLLDAIIEYERRRPLDSFKDVGVPADIYTVLGYLAEYMPDVLQGMDTNAHATVADGKALSAMMRANGWHNIPQVRACAFLRDEGIETVNGYPLDVLRAYFLEARGR